MIYQELIMKYLIWLGIPETDSYDIISKIKKKKLKETELSELKGKLLTSWKKRVGKEDGFIETWTVVEQAAHYSFNASHSLSYAYDSLYGAYLKSHYPLEYYTVALNYYKDDSERTLRLTHELSYFGIKLKPVKFRYSKSNYTLSRDDNSIYKGMESIKDMNAKVADELYELRNNSYSNFVSLLYDMQSKSSINSKQLRILIELDFFMEFGDANTLLMQVDFFNKFKNRSQFKKEELLLLGLSLDTIRKYAGRETEKMFTEVNFRGYAEEVTQNMKAKPRTLSEKITAQIEHLGYINIADERYSSMAAVLDVDTKYSPKLKLYSLKNGTTLDCKIDKKTFNKTKLKKGDIVRVFGTTKKPKVRKSADGKWETVEGQNELWITQYYLVENI